MTVFDLMADRPGAFQQAIASLKTVRVRPEVAVTAIPAPRKIAPYGVAVEADVHVAADCVSTGRFILLYDPEGQDAWNGNFRIVTYAEATMEPEIAEDSCLGSVGWSWLSESLDDAAATRHSMGGTVSREVNESFGNLADQPPTVDMQVRASWSPDSAEIGAHYAGWTNFMCTISGLPPLPVGVTALTRRA